VSPIDPRIIGTDEKERSHLQRADTARQVGTFAGISAWQNLPLAANWRVLDLNAISYGCDVRILPGGLVIMRGIVERVTSQFAYPTQIAALPPAAFPARDQYLHAYYRDGADTHNITRLIVSATSGAITVDQSLAGITNNGGVGTWVYLDGVTYPLL
jgi:hypothetical protein